MTFFPGWSYRPDDIAAAHDRMAAAGRLVAGGNSSFSGAWDASVQRGGVTKFLACEVDPFRGEKAYRQSTGVCTSMIYRAIQDCFNWDRVKFGCISRPVRIAFEPIFAGSRVAVGRGQLGMSDGSIGAWIAEWLATYGVIERGVYGGVDLSQPNEELAQYWGRPNVGVPKAVYSPGATHRLRAHLCRSTSELADALACGMFGGICRSHYASRVDSEGFARFDNPGGHHTCIRGAFIDRRGNTRVFVEQQSHGSGVPDPRPIARTTEGDIELGDGAYCVREDDIARFIRSGEVWVFQPIEGEEFR